MIAGGSIRAGVIVLGVRNASIIIITIIIVIIVGQGEAGIFEGKEDSEGCIRRHFGYR